MCWMRSRESMVKLTHGVWDDGLSGTVAALPRADFLNRQGKESERLFGVSGKKGELYEFYEFPGAYA